LPARLACLLRALFPFLLLLQVGSRSFRPEPPPAVNDAAWEAEAGQVVQDILSEHRHPWLKRADFTREAPTLQEQYVAANRPLLWFDGRRLRPQALELITVLDASEARGLRPADYDVAAIAGWSAAAQAAQGIDSGAAGSLDAALSLALLRQLSDVRAGRVDPMTLGIGFDTRSRRADLAQRALSVFAGGSVGRAISDSEPRLQQYRRLKAALPYYRSLAEQDLPKVSARQGLKPGDVYEGAGALRAVLTALGDVPAGGPLPAAPAEANVYAADLVQGVRGFQLRHGLNSDGVLGQATLDLLNLPARGRVRQIELALERFRWLPDTEGPTIGINIPSFRLWCFDLPAPDGRPMLDMKIVVGRAAATQTPIFAEQMRYMVLHPYWNAPYSIAVKELLPALEADPGYLASNDMEIVCGPGDSAPVVPAAADTVAQVRSGACRIRQRPGPRNALGRVVFVFPNAANVFLHDTPAVRLFARDRRDLSHGCMRVSDPLALAEWVMRGAQGWDRDRLARSMAALGPPLRVELPRPVSVLIFYTTAVSDVDGRIAFFQDVYGLDRRLDAALVR
jgi:murein L,D-transpeptidase YcbB/YkuD